MLASYALLAFGIVKKKETTFSILCILRYLADVSSFEEILTYHTSEDCRQLCFWKRAKQPFPGSAISKEEICSLLSFVFAGGVLNSQGRDNPRTPPKKKITKKKHQKIHCPLLNLGLSNELLHVVLASLCILSPSAQFCSRAIKQRRNLQLTIFRFRRWCIKKPGTGQPQDPPPPKKK